MILNHIFGSKINVHDEYNHNKTFIVLFGFSENYICEYDLKCDDCNSKSISSTEGRKKE